MPRKRTALPAATPKRAATTTSIDTARFCDLRLADLANVGPATLRDFRALGIATVAQLARHDAFRLYDRLCRRTGVRHDPCCIDVFMAAIDQARGGPPTPWWKFTETRKQILAGRGVARRYRGALAKLAR
jgi:nucleotidyltransferase/DNA polymerase involved in DNA repair